MYIPSHFLNTDREEIISFMREYSFATIVTGKDEIPVATHLPFIIRRRGDDIFLCSHYAKPNPQWRHLAGNKTLVIFSEPHAYISPVFYTHKVNVPTWNYLAVHAYGEGRLIEDEAGAFTLLEDMIDTFESDYKKQWQELPEDYKLKMVKGIVPFEIRVTELQGKKKLSQNKTGEERSRMIAAFEKSGKDNEREIARYMKTATNDFPATNKQ